MRVFIAVFTAVCTLLTAASSSAPNARAIAAPDVVLVRLPDGGIQPQAVVDDRGTAHVVFFKGEPGAGDLYYTRLDRRRQFSAPVRVNSVPNSAIATGSVRGAQLAVGRGGRVHVAWNGSSAVKMPDGGMPMLYARSNAGATSFEPQRNLMTWTSVLDGGGAIAADPAGHVYVVWHARGAREGEASRTVYVARSRDDGATFEKEQRAIAAEIGACACCGMRALVDPGGRLHLLYRAATNGEQRDATWLVRATKSPASESVAVPLHAWRLLQCPMSTFALARDGGRLLAAWETNKQIFTATLEPETRTFTVPAAMSGEASRRFPSLAVNAAGQRLVAWAEGTAWARGGTVAWQLYDRGGHQLAARAQQGEVPVWGLVAAVARDDGSFAIVH